MTQDEKLLKLQGWLLNEKQKAEDLVREGLNYEMEIKHRGRIIAMLETIIEIKKILNEAAVAKIKAFVPCPVCDTWFACTTRKRCVIIEDGE